MRRFCDRGRSCEPEVALDGCRPSGEWGAGYGGERETKNEKEGEIFSKLGVGYGGVRDVIVGVQWYMRCYDSLGVIGLF